MDQFNNYKRNNNIDTYRFFISNSSRDKALFVINYDDSNHPYIGAIPYVHEITNVHTLDKYVKLAVDNKIKLFLDSERTSISDLKKNALIQKLAGL